MSTPTLITFALYLIAMLMIGVFSYRFTSSLNDYMLGGRGLRPGVAALSAGASDMSGWILMGLPGAFYLHGMNQIWMPIGLTIGAWLNWQIVAKRLRIYTEVANDAITLPDYLENRFRDHSRVLRSITAIVILFFFTLYSAASMKAGGVLFEQSFELPYHLGLWIGAVAIVSYTFIGGFLAVCWTDTVQGVLMFLALLVVPIVVLSHFGGWGETVTAVSNMSPQHLNVTEGLGVFGICSLMAWGLGYFGQPHILVRFMAVRSAKDIPAARAICMNWMVLSLYGAIFTGFAGYAYYINNPLKDPETVFIQLSQILFNPWIAGILLAAILSAIMSTISSQLLVCASALTEDIYRGFIRKQAKDRELVMVGRLAVLLVALIAVVLAYNPNSTILSMVSYAWAGFGGAFGPVIILSLFWSRMTRNGAVAGIIVGAVVVVGWHNLSGGPGDMFDFYEILPGFVACLLTVIGVSLASKAPEREITREFALMKQHL